VVTGTTANFVSGVFTTQISGATITGNAAAFTTVTGGTATITSGVFASGTAGAPSVSVGTTDNGIYSPGTDQVAVATNGTGRLFVDASGNCWDNAYLAFGYGTTAAEQFSASIGRVGNNTLVLGTNNAERLRITSTGLVGIGVSGPNSTLHVAGSLTVNDKIFLQRASGSLNLPIASYWDGSTNPLSGTKGDIVAIGNTGGDGVAFVNADTERMRLTSTGLGIGTSAPGKTLEVNGSFRQSGAEFLIEPTASNTVVSIAPQTSTNGAILRFTNGSTTSYFGKENSTGGYTWSSGGTAYATVISAYGSTAPIQFGHNSPSVTLDSSGRLGIGTTSPGAPLEVNGNASASNFSVPDTNFIGFGSYTAYLSGSSASNFINFSTGSTERARIDSSGRLLVGTSTGTSRLSIAGTADNANSEIQITATGVASGYIGANSNGLNIGTDTAGLVFKTGVAGGGSVGASGTERMRIDNSGRLLVGTSSARSNVYRGASSLISPVQIDSNANSYSNGINVLNYSGSGYGSVLTLGMSLSNTQGTNTVVRNNDELGYLNFVGNDGTNFRTGAWIGGEVDGTPGAGDMPGRLVFSTTADGASSPTEACRITSNQDLLLSQSGSGIFVGTTVDGAFRIGRSSFAVSTGTLYIGNAAIQVSSDIRLKDNIQDTSLNALEAISKIKVKDFTWSDPSDTSYNNRNARGKWTGLIAQELVDVLPFVVNAPRKEEDGSIDHDSDSIWTLDQSQLCPVLIKAVQQQQEIITALEARLTAAGL
jgi:hypothetical protein